MGSEQGIHVVFFIRKLVRGLGLNFLKIYGHLGSKTFLRLSYYEVRADTSASCRAGRPVNLGDEKGQKVPCQLILNGGSRFIAILREQLKLLQVSNSCGF